jgi:uncharacterized protein YndB with AHSA1/START domain
MQRIVESIEIHRPPQAVFAFLRDIEARVRLNPSYTVVGFEALTHQEPCPGARYRFFLMANGKRMKHECEVTEFVENKKIVSRAIDDSLRLTLTLKETPGGTLLTHDEKFSVPQEVFERPGHTNPLHFFQELWPKAQHLTAGLGFYDGETETSIKELEEALRSNLRTWLERVREKIESCNT